MCWSKRNILYIIKKCTKIYELIYTKSVWTNCFWCNSNNHFNSFPKYLGLFATGMELIEKAINEKSHSSDFIWKMIFTSITLASGFKGGEIVPSFCIGATFGCLFGYLFNMSRPVLCASIGMVSLFCGVTNCPISSLIILHRIIWNGCNSLLYVSNSHKLYVIWLLWLISGSVKVLI